MFTVFKPSLTACVLFTHANTSILGCMLVNSSIMKIIICVILCKWGRVGVDMCMRSCRKEANSQSLNRMEVNSIPSAKCCLAAHLYAEKHRSQISRGLSPSREKAACVYLRVGCYNGLLKAQKALNWDNNGRCLCCCIPIQELHPLKSTFRLTTDMNILKMWQREALSK